LGDSGLWIRGWGNVGAKGETNICQSDSRRIGASITLNSCVPAWHERPLAIGARAARIGDFAPIRDDPTETTALIHAGELAAMGTALLWTLSALAWTTTGRHIGALAVSFIRLAITSVFLLAYGQLFRGLCLPTDATGETWLLLGISGFVGFFLADVCLFKALLVIGPRLTLLLQTLVPPMTAVISWVWLGDHLGARDWLAMAVTLSGVTWVVLERPNGRQATHDRQRLRQGVVLAVLAAAGQAVGMVIAKEGLGDYDAVAATFIRVIGALVGYVASISLIRRWPSILTAVRRGRIMAIVAFGSFVGPFLGVVLLMIALRDCRNAGVPATIISTTPVWILPLMVILYREKVSLRAAGGAVLSVVGVALLVL